MGTREIAASPSGRTHPLERGALIASFTDRASQLGVTVIHAADATAAAAALETRFETRDPLVSSELAEAAPAFCAALVAQGLALAPPGTPDETNEAPLGFSLAHLAVAETGSVLLAEETPEDRAIGLVTKEQFVVCPTKALVPSLDDAASVLRAFALRPGGTYTTLVTGPSRTADIERTLTVGVQGPARLSVLFVDDLT